MKCSRRILLALIGLLCLLGHGLGASLPNEDQDDNVVPIDQLMMEAAKQTVQSPMYFSEHTHLIRKELDMVFTMPEIFEMEKHKSSRRKRTAAIRPSWNEKRWTNNVVNYELESGTFSIRDMREIYSAVRDITHYTCVSMQESDTATNRVQLQKGFGGCYSRVGMVGGVQPLGLGNGCRYKRVIIHEMLHAIGIHHEQTRPDRDEHVTIRFDRIDDNMEHNFEKYNWGYINNHSLPYDYHSVMHYGPTAFATSWGSNTIETEDPQYQNVIGKNPGLSMYDIRTLNSMHNCVPASCNLRDQDCAKEFPGGFVGKDCTCWCPGPDQFSHPVERCVEADVDAKGSLRNACRDFQDGCPSWASSGYCNNQATWGYMFTYCGKSCNAC